MKLTEITQRPWYRITPRMIDQARSNKCQIIVDMPARDFIYLTTRDQAAADIIHGQAAPLHRYNLSAKAGQDYDFRDRLNRDKTKDDPDYVWGTVIMPFLTIQLDPERPYVVGHEGRHRAAALLRAGQDRITVAICMRPTDDMFPTDFGAIYRVRPEHLPARIFGQFNEGRFVDTTEWKVLEDLQANMRARFDEGADIDSYINVRNFFYGFYNPEQDKLINVGHTEHGVHVRKNPTMYGIDPEGADYEKIVQSFYDRQDFINLAIRYGWVRFQLHPNVHRVGPMSAELEGPTGDVKPYRQTLRKINNLLKSSGSHIGRVRFDTPLNGIKVLTSDQTEKFIRRGILPRLSDSLNESVDFNTDMMFDKIQPSYFFYNPESNRIINVGNDEHSTYLAKHPDRFGLDPGEVVKHPSYSNALKGHFTSDLLDLAKQLGWVRVGITRTISRTGIAVRLDGPQVNTRAYRDTLKIIKSVMDRSGVSIRSVMFDRPIQGVLELEKDDIEPFINKGHLPRLRHQKYEIPHLKETTDFHPWWFWYHPDRKRLEAVEGTHTSHGLELGYGNHDEHDDLADDAIISMMIDQGWVRGRYGMIYSTDTISSFTPVDDPDLDGSDEKPVMSLQGKQRNVVRAARDLIRRGYVFDILYVDFDQTHDSMHEQESHKLTGTRLKLFLKNGSIPSHMVLESTDQYWVPTKYWFNTKNKKLIKVADGNDAYMSHHLHHVGRNPEQYEKNRTIMNEADSNGMLKYWYNTETHELVNLPSGTHHVLYVMAHPKLFGLKQQQIQHMDKENSWNIELFKLLHEQKWVRVVINHSNSYDGRPARIIDVTAFDYDSARTTIFALSRKKGNFDFVEIDLLDQNGHSRFYRSHARANTRYWYNHPDSPRNLKTMGEAEMTNMNGFTHVLAESLDSVHTYGPEEIAHHHGVPVEEIEDQLRTGIEVETEHTTDRDEAREIALDHLLEMPDYYTRLTRMERNDEICGIDDAD